MEGLFLTKDDNFKIDFVIAKDAEGKLLVAKNKQDMLNEHKDVNVDDIENHWAVFKLPSFSDYVKTNAKGMTTNMDGELELNLWALRQSRMENLLLSWSFENDINSENVGSLSPVVAMFLMEQVEDQIIM